MSFLDAKDGSFRPNNATKLVLLFGSMLVLMGSAAVSPALHSIEEELETSKFLVSLIISLPPLIVAVMGFPLGYVADRIGSATVFIVSLLVFCVSGTAGYFCTDIASLLATRVFLGIGIAGIGTTATALMGIYYSGDERMRVMAIQSAFMGFGGVVLESVGGFMADIAWNTPFLIYLISAPIFLAGLFCVRNIDLEGHDIPAESASEGNGGRNQSLFLLVSIFMLMFVMFVVSANMSDLLTKLDVSMTVCGLVIALMGLVQTFVSIGYSRMKHLPKYTHILVAAFLLQAVAMFLIGVENLAVICIGVSLIGIALGIAMPTIVNNLSRLAPASDQGKVMGLYNVMMNLGTAVSGMVVSSLTVAMGFAPAFCTVGILIALYAVVTLLFGRSVHDAVPADE